MRTWEKAILGVVLVLGAAIAGSAALDLVLEPSEDSFAVQGRVQTKQAVDRGRRELEYHVTLSDESGRELTTLVPKKVFDRARTGDWLARSDSGQYAFSSDPPRDLE